MRISRTTRFARRGLGATCALLIAPLALAQIMTDGSVGPSVSLSGPAMTIGAELGTTRGSNLFHSFQRFDIPTDHRATFTGPEQIQNVIGRVTGGSASSIDGTLRSEVGQADLYLINPSGVVLGPNAHVDVPAALHLSTADEVRFSDGARYSASDPCGSTLSMAAPEAFGFLAPQPASLEVVGSQLSLRAGQTLSLSAGDVDIRGTEEQMAVLAAPAGALHLAAVGEAGGAVAVTGASASPGSGTLVVNSAMLGSSGDGGGSITLRAGEAQLDTAYLIAENQGASDATGGIDLEISDALSLSQSEILSATAASGSAGTVRITAGNAVLDGLSFIASDSYRAEYSPSEVLIGNAGSVQLRVRDQLEMGAGSQIRSFARAEGDAGSMLIESGLLEVLDGAQILNLTFTSADAGNLTIKTGELRLTDQGFISSSVQPGSSGQAGWLDIAVDGLLEVRDGAQISSSTWGMVDAAGMIIDAGELRLDGGGLSHRKTGISSNAYSGSSGQAGALDLNVDGLLEVLNGAEISSATFSSGDAGRVSINAGALRLDGGGLTTMFTAIASSAYPGSSGQAGTLSLSVDGLLEVLHGAEIASSTWGGQHAGSVTIEAGDLRLDGGGLNDVVTVISSNAEFGSGHAGVLELSVDGLLEVLNGAKILSYTRAEGHAGNIIIETDALHMDGGGLSDMVTTIASHSLGSGHAGTLHLSVEGLLEVRGGAEISSNTWAEGHAGYVTIEAGALRLDGGDLDDVITVIASSAQPGSSGNAGSLELTVTGLMEVLNDARISSSTFAQGDAGAVAIEAGQLRLEHAGIDSAATSTATGQVGDILIDVQHGRIDLSADSTISIGSYQTLTDSAQPSDNHLSILANTLSLENSTITAESSGNVPAAAIEIQAQGIQLTDASRITTESQAADAGPIRIDGGSLWLTDSQITTSAKGGAGDGGTITLGSGHLILDGGFIQANTAASGARGGDILINNEALIARERQLSVGASERQRFVPGSGLNIIQAAAPGGEQGDIRVTSPSLDLVAGLVTLSTAMGNPDELINDPCRTSIGMRASSLAWRGCGALVPDPGEPIALPLNDARLKALLE